MYARIAAGLLLAAAAVGQTPGGGQAPDPVEEDPGLIISVESKLVVVPLHVYRKNNSVGGLDADAFELLEDGVAQNIAFVEGPAGPGEDPNKGRTVPTEIILLIDVSHSVIKPGLLDIRTIRSAMLDGLREDVSISLYGFACNLKRFSGPTRDPAKLQAALEAAYAAEAGCSRVYEAIMQTVRDAANRGGNVSRMMVVFSDGFSTTDLSTDLVVQSANAFGIPLYPVILGHEQIVDRAYRGGVGASRAGKPECGRPVAIAHADEEQSECGQPEAGAGPRAGIPPKRIRRYRPANRRAQLRPERHQQHGHPPNPEVARYAGADRVRCRLLPEQRGRTAHCAYGGSPAEKPEGRQAVRRPAADRSLTPRASAPGPLYSH